MDSKTLRYFNAVQVYERTYIVRVVIATPSHEALSHEPHSGKMLSSRTLESSYNDYCQKRFLVFYFRSSLTWSSCGIETTPVSNGVSSGETSEIWNK
jgi:hypothetical protein